MASGPLTTGQMAALRAVEDAGDRGAAAPTIAQRAGLKVGGIYMLLGRLVRRKLVTRSKEWPPRYTLSPAGERHLRASELYRDLTEEG